MLAVILVSAFQRLLIYEQAYGFTRLRTVTHIFMVWLGILLVFLVIIELWGRLRYFALAVLVVVLGFGFTLNILNIDAFIVRQNVTRSLDGAELDIEYLLTLSNDSIPTLSKIYADPALPTGLKNDLGSILACREKLLSTMDPIPWQSFHFSDYIAMNTLSSNHDDLISFEMLEDEDGIGTVSLNGKVEPCSNSRILY